MRHYELAQLIACAVNDPSKMPDFELTGGAPAASAAEISDEAEQARARGALIAMALASRKGKS